MTGRGTIRRGQPLIFLAALVLGWIGLRAVLWEDLTLPLVPSRLVAAAPAALPAALAITDVSAAPGAGQNVAQLPAVPHMRATPVPVPPVGLVPLPAVPTVDVPLTAFAPGGAPRGPGDEPRLSGTHQLAWLAGVSQLPVPQFIRDRLSGTDRSASLFPAEARAARLGGASTDKRWSVDGWLLLRRGGEALTTGGLAPPSYGASQAGAVVRYRLAPSSSHRPAAYLRVTSALQAPRGAEAAVGLAARPLPRVPLSLQAELRSTQFAAGTVVRPAIGLVTELERFSLPAGLSAELYGQAGYVGGTGATAYAEGQARVERRIAAVGRGELRLGAGAWGGAQRGAARVDVGPAAVLDFKLGPGQGRIAADWRFRVAGNAAPRSGPAVTLSAGF
jgi:hypothetical protein